MIWKLTIIYYTYLLYNANYPDFFFILQKMLTEKALMSKGNFYVFFLFPYDETTLPTKSF